MLENQQREEITQVLRESKAILDFDQKERDRIQSLTMANRSKSTLDHVNNELRVPLDKLNEAIVESDCKLFATQPHILEINAKQ